MLAKSVLILGILAGLLAPAQALAQSAETAISAQATLQGSAPASCRLNTPTAPSSSNASISALSVGSASIAIDQLVDEDGELLGATVVLVLPAVCNQAHVLNLSSLNGGLRNDEPETAGPFRSRVPYTVTVSWNGGTQTFVTDNQLLSLPVADAASGAITVTIVIPRGGAPLVAGAFSDELTLEMGAAG